MAGHPSSEAEYLALPVHQEPASDCSGREPFLVRASGLSPGPSPWSGPQSLVRASVLGPGLSPWSWPQSLVLASVLGPGLRPWFWSQSLVLVLVLSPGTSLHASSGSDYNSGAGLSLLS